ncbi:MAG: heparinase II/III-family protein, partial [Burkholderiales bacterium]|nr:heparinase II/III-family protein [Opitutaceae bacterium]
RGTMEHASFQDALVAIGDPLAYNTAFWRNTAYFQIYTVQPYRHTAFGDLSNAGKFDIEPRSAEFLIHLSRVLRDGRIVSYANLAQVEESPAEAGLKGLNRTYPTAAEFLIRNFTVAHLPVPAPTPLDDLPPSRYFADVGWVAMHSALGRANDDIHVTFKSSPYGSFSHSHADQNAFILNAYGEDLAINSGYREFHRSPHHSGWTWQTKSKNALLIDGKGQKSQNLAATGRILKYDTGPRHTWTVGDATAAYQTLQPAGRVKSVLRDLVFIDQRYLVVRDRVELATPGKLTWLLHAERPITWNAADATALIRGEKATLTTRLIAPAGVTWRATIQDKFDVPVDPKYAGGGVTGFTYTGKWAEQSHLLAETAEASASHLVFAVLWPERDGQPAKALEARLAPDGRLQVKRPDGRTDVLTLSEAGVTLQ